MTTILGLSAFYHDSAAALVVDGAIVAAAELSDRYVTNRFLPDKAIDLIDEVALSYVKKDFLKISVLHINELKKNDILVIGLRENNTPLHLAVYLGDNMVIHHPRNKYVTTEKVTSSFVNRIIYAYRPQ